MQVMLPAAASFGLCVLAMLALRPVAVVIDLVARLVVADSSDSSPGPTGAVCYHDGQGATETRLRYHLADDWLLTSDVSRWRAVAEGRRAPRAAE